MSPASFHDVIIVGSDVAGLMAAGMLCRKKYRVLVVGQGQPGITYQDRGISLPALPSLMPPFGHAPVLDQVLNDLGVEDPVHQLGSADNNALQVVTPDQRITLDLDRSELETELQRAFPDQKTSVLALIDDLRSVDERFREILSDHPPLPPQGLRERTRIRRLVSALEEKQLPPLSSWPPLLRILAAATGFLSHLDHQARPTFVTGHLVLALLGGLRNVSDFSERLLKSIQQGGGEVETKTVAEQILIERKQATGVRTLRRSNVYKCGIVVTGLPIDRALELVPLGHRHKHFLAIAHSVRQVGSLFAINLIVPTESLPLGMGDQLLLVRSTDEPLEEDNLIRLHRLELAGRKGRSLVNLSCLVPFSKRSLGREFMGPLQTAMIESAARLIPFLQDHLEAQTSPFWESRAGDEPHPAPWSLHAVYEAEHEVGLGCAALHSQTPFGNVFYCGPESVPGLGLEGAAHAAAQTVRQVTRKLKLKKIL